MTSILVVWAITVGIIFGIGYMASLDQITTGEQLIATLLILLWQQAS